MRRTSPFAAPTVFFFAAALVARSAAAQGTPAAQAQGTPVPGAVSPAAGAPAPGAQGTPNPGQPAPAGPAAVTPPRIKTDPGAVYPKEAASLHLREPVTVVLILDVDPQGRVSDVRVENPKATPFEAAAAEAAQGLELEPAQRAGRPIAARIKHKYTFPPLPGRLAGRLFDQGNGAPLRNVPVTLVAEDGTRTTLVTDELGRFRSEDLPFGRYHVEAAPEGYTPLSADEEVNPAEEASLTLRLAPAAGAAADAAAATAKDDVVEEVVVRGTRPPREVTRRTIEQREILRIPGNNGDAIRSIQNFPGVARPPGLAGVLIVRGAAPNSTAIFVDGTLVPIVFHFGGLSSVIPTEFLEKIDFFPGNFSSYYGRVSAGIVDVGVRSPRKDKIHGLAQVDLVDARALVEAPLGKGFRFSAGARRSWLDLTLAPVLRATGAAVTAAPAYYDYQALLEKDIGKDGSFRLFLFGSDDRFEVIFPQGASNDPGIGGGFNFATSFWRIQARYRQRLGAGTEVRAVAAVGQDFIQFGIGDNRLQINTTPISLRGELAQKIAPGTTLNVGIDWLYTPYDVFARLPPPNPPGRPPPGPGFVLPPVQSQESGTLYRPAAYAELEYAPIRGTRVVPGVRVDYTRETKSWDVSPRIIGRQDLHSDYPRTTLKGGVGVFHQPPAPNETSPVFGVPSSKDARATQYSFGVEQELTRNVEVSFEGFYRLTDRLFTEGSGSVGEGRAYGLETLLRYRPDARFFGWLAYTLSRSEIRDTPSEPWRTFQFDQTHILTVLGSYRLGHGWEVGARFRFISGNLTTPQTYGFLDENAGVNLAARSYPPFSERLPAFNSLDVRVDKIWDFGTWRLNAYLDIVNVYNQANVEGYQYNFNFTKRTTTNGLPILPSLGLRAEL